MSYARLAIVALVLAGCTAGGGGAGGGGGDLGGGGGGGGVGGGGGGVGGAGGVGGGGGGGAGGGGGGGGTQPSETVIRVHYPAGAHALALRGDGGGLTWDHGLALAAGSDDTFTARIANLDQAFAFKPLLDDATWSLGPNYHVTPGATVDVYPHFVNARGSFSKLIASFASTALGNTRAIWAYLPASYAENTRARYPVLYMHDGQNLFDPSLAFGGHEWQVDETLDAAAADGSIAEIIVIGVENTAGRMNEYTPTADPAYPQGGGGDKYLMLLADELKPQIDAMLRTVPDRAHTGIMGSSLGGLISAYAGVKRPDVFGIVGAMSPSTWWNETVIIGDVMAMPSVARPARVYVDCGDASDDRANTDMLAKTYVAIGYQPTVNFLQVLDDLGKHNEIYWAKRLPAALGFLFGPRQP